jgi:hypothetical protein
MSKTNTSNNTSAFFSWMCYAYKKLAYGAMLIDMSHVKINFFRLFLNKLIKGYELQRHYGSVRKRFRALSL